MLNAEDRAFVEGRKEYYRLIDIRTSVNQSITSAEEANYEKLKRENGTELKLLAIIEKLERALEKCREELKRPEVENDEMRFYIGQILAEIMGE